MTRYVKVERRPWPRPWRRPDRPWQVSWGDGEGPVGFYQTMDGARAAARQLQVVEPDVAVLIDDGGIVVQDIHGALPMAGDTLF